MGAWPRDACERAFLSDQKLADQEVIIDSFFQEKGLVFQQLGCALGDHALAGKCLWRFVASVCFSGLSDPDSRGPSISSSSMRCSELLTSEPCDMRCCHVCLPRVLMPTPAQAQTPITCTPQDQYNPEERVDAGKHCQRGALIEVNERKAWLVGLRSNAESLFEHAFTSYHCWSIKSQRKHFGRWNLPT